MKFKVLEKKGVDIPENKKHYKQGEVGDEDASVVTALARTKSVEIIEKKEEKK